MKFVEFGALVFGVVVGFITYRTLIRTADKTAVSDLATVLAAIGGAAVTSLYGADGNSFAWYAIGLPVGMAIYFVLHWSLNGKASLAAVMSGGTITSTDNSTGQQDGGRPHA